MEIGTPTVIAVPAAAAIGYAINWAVWVTKSVQSHEVIIQKLDKVADLLLKRELDGK